MIEIIHNTNNSLDINRLYDLLATVILEVEVEANTDTTEQSA